MTLGQQIALALRHRPLLLPMLLATLFVDVCVTLVIATADRFTAEFNICYWGILLPQLGMVSLWAAHSACRLGIRIAAVMVAIGWMLIAIMLGPGEEDLGGLLAVLLAYSGVLIALVLGTRLLWHLRSANAWYPALRFSMWQLMLIMTLTAVLAALGRYMKWPLYSHEIPIFALLVFTPLLTLATYSQTWMPWRWLPALALGGIAEWFYLSGDLLNGVFLGNALVCCVWLQALSVMPDARRRRMGRQQRRRPAIELAPETVAMESEATAQPPTSLPFDADV